MYSGYRKYTYTYPANLDFNRVLFPPKIRRRKTRSAKQNKILFEQSLPHHAFLSESCDNIAAILQNIDININILNLKIIRRQRPISRKNFRVTFSIFFVPEIHLSLFKSTRGTFK